LQSRERALKDARDRRFVHLLVLTTLRWRGALDRVLAPLVHGGLERLDPIVRAALRSGLAEATRLERPAGIAVSATVDAVRRATGRGAEGVVNAVLRRALAGGVPALDERATMPEWLLARWSRSFGPERADQLVSAANRAARPFLIARPDRGGRERLVGRLAAAGVTAVPSRLHPWGVEVREGAPQSTPCFTDGSCIAMDAAAALVAALAWPVDDRPIADLAAAPGGKSILIALAAKRPVVALELGSERASRLARTVRLRAPEDRVGVVRADARRPPLPRSRFGLVLLDAPCSGTGTLRRRPDRRWRLEEGQIGRLVRLQDELLEAAAELVCPGGALVYSVCSLEPEEGTGRIAAFLGRYAEFRVEDPRPFLAAAARGLVDQESRVLATRPETDDVDGFVAARMVREPGRRGA
ncbi:MAG: RsmB/NOP family class I SAM-dependent RNA methyltransferase, partial [Acidobacteriota bacterium]|nr:RsmB/NOP family class I SAM-dependent RNA methyltransferase [Acidobacteriota bacterium]